MPGTETFTEIPAGARAQACSRCGYAVWWLPITDEAAQTLSHFGKDERRIKWTILEPRSVPGLGSMAMTSADAAAMCEMGEGDLRRHYCPAITTKCKHCGQQIKILRRQPEAWSGGNDPNIL